MKSHHRAWALFRFTVIAPLFCDPPKSGELKERIERLAKTTWTHPVTKEPVTFAFSTIERWYYVALEQDVDPVAALTQSRRSDYGTHQLCEPLATELRSQHRTHPCWSYQLHHDNLAAFAAQQDLTRPPTYTTIRRYMQAHGLLRQKRLGSAQYRSEAVQVAEAYKATYEQRSFEKEHVGALWHLDFHQAKAFRVITPAGRWIRPFLLGILDDHSRFACHVQWYETENAENLVHGLTQALLKHGRPRSLLSDNGAAEIAAEVTAGLPRLGIHHDKTLPRCPNQNAKQESFWCTVEGRLLAMIESLEAVTLAQLNDYTSAWAEMEYNRSVHSEIDTRPLDRFLHGKNVLRPSPTVDECRDSFRRQETRRQRFSDGTISLRRTRFEIPSRFRHLRQIVARFAKWDLGFVHLVDEATDSTLAAIHAIDKAKNADRARRRFDDITPSDSTEAPSNASNELPALMKRLMSDYSALGLPPAYLPSPNPNNRKDESCEN